MAAVTAPPRPLTNAEISRRLVEVAEMLRAKGENTYKVRAYRRAAETVSALSESIHGMVHGGQDLTRFPGIGKGIAAALREIVLRSAGCFFEVNASPDRLDLSSENVRLVTQAGIKIAVNTDAHHIRELDYLSCGIDVARRGGAEKQMVLNTMPWSRLERLFHR